MKENSYEPPVAAEVVAAPSHPRRSRLATVIPAVLFVLGLVVLPFMMAIVFCAVAEIGFGHKDPLFETGLGFLAGIFLAAMLASAIPRLRQVGRTKDVRVLLILLLAFDLPAIPLAIWMLISILMLI